MHIDLDAFFVSVSAASVTGLSSVDFTDTFTRFGDIVIMVLVQVGGLGVMTFTTLGALLVGQRVGFRGLLTVREELGSVDSPRNTFRLLGQIAGITLIVELLGVVVLTVFAPEEIIGIAYDSGGVTTSTITVPLVTALGVGLASSIKGRNPMVDGFGLIAFASLTPMMFVMIYGMLI